jgi:hypothetical protein
VARNGLDLLDLVADLVVEDSVGEEHEPVVAGVGVCVSSPTSLVRNTLDLMLSTKAFLSVGRVPGSCRSRGAILTSSVYYNYLQIPTNMVRYFL